MSTYGLVVVADLPDAGAAEALVARVKAALIASWGAGESPVEDLEYEVVDVDAGVRVSINVQGMVADRREADFFAGAPAGRAVICEDGDEYGVLFQVWRLDPAGSECVYRAYVHDPDEDPEPATAARAITGAEPAAAAAELYGVDPQVLLDLEADPSPVSDELGVIGTPFEPWLSHFGVQWPDLG
ncbi:hypothetical protein [Gordonia sp. (in: high G+C Gram-positive bacteria)]|uniref:hypothetical protein n=1 Tax=Gordonia sp. (in: high G+C Gram-positive bacteria) TaxID=84139 RepID=UPI003C77D431